MGNLTKNISDFELKCSCGGCEVRVQDHEPIINIVQDACDHFAKKLGVARVALKITSAARCYVYNRLPIEFGGAGSNDESQHPRCNAIDFKIFINNIQVSPLDINGYLCDKYPDQYGFGLYKGFNHADSRPIKRRWRKL